MYIFSRSAILAYPVQICMYVPPSLASGWSSSDGGGGPRRSRSWGALHFGGNEAWSEIYTTRLRPLGLDPREGEEEEEEEERDRDRSTKRRVARREERAERSGGGGPEPDNIPLKDERLPDLSILWSIVEYVYLQLASLSALTSLAS